MNAYELANYLVRFATDYKISNLDCMTLSESIDMLRQQADRIKVLEEQTKHLESQVYGGTTK